MIAVRQNLPFLVALALGLLSAAAAAQRGPGAPDIMQDIPYQIDPGAPGLSRAEMIQRQQELLREIGRRANTPARTPTPQQVERALAIREGGEEAVAGDEPVRIRLSSAPRVGLPEEKTDANAALWTPMVVYLSPGGAVARPGETFTTEARVFNLQRDYLDRIDLVIAYPPESIEPVSLHEDGIKSMLAGPAEWGIDPKRGEIRYRARLAQPLRVIDLRVLSVVWRALRPADEVPIGLLSDEAHSGAYLGATLLSENEFGPAGALAGTIARISLDRSDAADGGRSVRDPFDSLRSAAGAAVDRRPIALWIDYESKPIYQPGEWVVFDVYLENPDLASFDDLRLALRFDPRDLVFADTDLRNLVHRGVNALDAPFRSNWGWHTTVANEIDNARGRIDYRVRGSAMSPKKSGVLVRAIAQVKRIAAEPLLTWTDDGREAVGAYLLGANLLGELDGRRVAAGPTVGPRGEVFSIRPGVFGERADPALYRDRPSGAFEAFYPELYRLIRK